MGWEHRIPSSGPAPGAVVRGVRWQTLWALFTDGETDWEEDNPHFFAYQHASFFDPSADMGLVGPTRASGWGAAGPSSRRHTETG